MGHEGEVRRTEEEMQDDLEVSVQDAEKVAGGSTGNKVVTNPPPVVSATMDVKP